MSASAQEKRAPAEAVADLRNTLDWLRAEGDLIETDREVDPDLQITGLQKRMDGETGRCAAQSAAAHDGRPGGCAVPGRSLREPGRRR